jgi:copper chaperone CopZ
MEGETLERVELRSDGISGDGDADRLETDLAAIDGVRDVEVNTDSHTVSVSYDPRQVSYPKIREAVEAAGYSVTYDSAATGAAARPAASDI